MSTRDFRTEFGVKRATLLPLWDDANAATNLKYTELDGLPGIKVFSCHRLKASLTATSCASNFADAKHMACVGCPIGSAHRDAIAMKPVSMDRYDKAVKDAARWDSNKGIACVRCERTGATATTFVARFRLIKSRGLCVTCYNRQREVEIGVNSKGATPVKWAHLKPTIVTIGVDGKRETLDIGLRGGWSECDRFVKQAHPGAELIEVVIGGEIIPPFSLWLPLPFSPWAPTVKKPLRIADLERRPVEDNARRSPGGRGLVSDISGERFGELTAISPAGFSDPGGNAVWRFRCECGTEKVAVATYVKLGRVKSCGCASRGKAWLPPLQPEQALEYEQSFEDNEPVAADQVEPICADRSVVLESDEDELILDAWPRLAADTLPQFIAWLASDWPTLASDARATTSKVRAPVADSEAAVSPAWREVFGDLDEHPKQRKQPLPPMTAEEDAAYRATFDSEHVEPSEPAADISAPEHVESVGESIVEPAAKHLLGNVDDITGQRFGLLTALEYERSNLRGCAVWRELVSAKESAVVPSVESAATVEPKQQPTPALEPVKRPHALGEPRRVFHPLLKRLGFEPRKLYGSVMPLAVDQYMGKKSVVLFGCLCATTFKAPAQAVLRGHTTSCGCGAKPDPAKPAHDLAAYLRTLKALPPYRPWLSTTCWHRIQVGTYAYARSAS